MTKQQAIETLDRKLKGLNKSNNGNNLENPTTQEIAKGRAIQCDPAKLAQYWRNREKALRPQPQLSAAPSARKGYVL